MNDYEQGFEKGYERGKVDTLLVLRDYMNELLGKNKKQSSGIKNGK